MTIKNSYARQLASLGVVLYKPSAEVWDRTIKLDNGLVVRRTSKGVTVHNTNANGGYFHSPLKVSADEGTMLGNVRLPKVNLSVDQSEAHFFNQVSRLGRVVADQTWKKHMH